MGISIWDFQTLPVIFNKIYPLTYDGMDTVDVACSFYTLPCGTPSHGITLPVPGNDTRDLFSVLRKSGP